MFKYCSKALLGIYTKQCLPWFGEEVKIGDMKDMGNRGFSNRSRILTVVVS